MPTNKSKRGLGRGVDALFATISEATADGDHNETVVEISLDDIRPNPYQPRKTFDDEALAELADSIRKTGVFQPIILRQSAVKGYEIVAGERRVRASKLAGKQSIPAIVRPLDETAMIEIAVIENLQREDLNPLEEAEAYQMLMTKLSLTQVEVAQRIGKSRPYIANYLRLLGLPLAIKKMLQNNQLSMAQARTLLALEQPDEMELLAHRVVAEGLTVRQLEELVHLKETPKSKKAKTKAASAARPFYVVEGEERLTDRFGTSVHIVDKDGRGKIEIEYLSRDDLTRIFDLLNIQFD